MPIEPFFFYVDPFYYLEIHYTMNLIDFHFIFYLWTDYFSSLFFFIRKGTPFRTYIKITKKCVLQKIQNVKIGEALK